MALSNAERQARYREKRKAGRNDERRINTYINSNAHLALMRLARHFDVTNRQMLERLIMDSDDRIAENLEVDTPEWKQYCSVTQ